jgi:exonuclease SbcD
MKIGIIGDTHFGAGYNLGKLDPDTQLNSRLLDFSNTFNSIIDRFLKRDVKVVVITGDIFDTRHPTSAQLNTFSRCIQRAINKDLQIVILVGNHDQQRTIATTTVDIYNSLETPGVSVYANLDVHTIRDKYGKKINLILMPYRDRRMIGTKTTSDAVEQIRGELNAICDNLDGTKIAVGHFMMDRAIAGENPDTFSINELILPLDIFKNLDGVVMGHVHKHAILSKKPLIAYAGSMEKISFGEKHHTKVTLVLDTDDLSKVEVIKSNIRNLYEMNFNYTTGEKNLKHQITDTILLDIEKFHMKWNLSKAIVKLTAKVKENDLYYVNQEKIKEYILSKNVKYLSPVQISSVNFRKLRNKNITENVSGKKAMTAFINELIEPEQIKKKLIKFANNVIEAVEGK